MIPVPRRDPTSPKVSDRRDARRNRERLVRAATIAFTESSGPVKLEDIAAAADVGVGTLYRNFPSREALVEEVYRVELARLCEDASRLVRRHSPPDALRAWLRKYQAFVATKRGMADALRDLVAGGAITSTQTRAQLTAAIKVLLDAGIADGSLRPDVRPDDVVANFAGIIIASVDAAQARRLLDFLAGSLRATA